MFLFIYIYVMYNNVMYTKVFLQKNGFKKHNAEDGENPQSNCHDY